MDPHNQDVNIDATGYQDGGVITNDLLFRDPLLQGDNLSSHPFFSYTSDSGFDLSALSLSPPPPSNDNSNTDRWCETIVPNNTLSPRPATSYANMCGVPVHSTRLVRILIVVTQSIDRIKSLCNEVTLSLSQYALYCDIQVYHKDDCFFALEHIYFDICITQKEFLNVITLSYPSLCCSYIELSQELTQEVEDRIFARICTIVQLYIRENPQFELHFEYNRLLDLSKTLFPSMSS